MTGVERTSSRPTIPFVPGTMKQQWLLATCPKTPTEDDIADILTTSVENW